MIKLDSNSHNPNMTNEDEKMNSKVSTRNKIGDLLLNRKIIALEIIGVTIIAVLNILNPTILILLIAAISLWARRKKWRDLGFTKPTRNEIILGIAIGILLPFIGSFVIGPFISELTGVPRELSLFAY